jgi:adenine-specific DNA-methyltransferase
VRQVFDTKTTKIVKKIQLSSNKNDDIILIFCGFRNNRHAIFEQNKEWHFSQKYYIQLEVLLESNREQSRILFLYEKQSQPTISELTKERLRRAGKKVREDNPDWNGDIGFRVFKLDTSNIRPWEATAKPFHNNLMPI